MEEGTILYRKEECRSYDRKLIVFKEYKTTDYLISKVNTKHNNPLQIF